MPIRTCFADRRLAAHHGPLSYGAKLSLFQNELVAAPSHGVAGKAGHPNHHGHEVAQRQQRHALGAAEPAKLRESLRSGKPLPSLHSSLFYPDAEPAIRTGVAATTAAALELLKK